MESVEDRADKTKSLPALGLIGARPTLRNDTATLNALIDDLLAFIRPYGDGFIYSSEPRNYRTTVEGRALLTQALGVECIAELHFGVTDPEMPVEYRGTTYNGPDVLIFFQGGGETDVGVTVQLTPRWSHFQARLAAELTAFIARWASHLNASSALVTGGSEGERNVFYNYVAPDPEWRTQYALIMWDGSELLDALTGLTASMPTSELAPLRNHLALPVRLLDTLCYLDGSDLIVTQGANASVLSNPVVFNLYFDRSLTVEERSLIHVAINAWEDEFYARFDDDWYFPTRLAINENVVRWRVFAAQGHGQSVDKSGNGVDTRALKELQDWLLLLPNIEVTELVLGIETVG